MDGKEIRGVRIIKKCTCMKCQRTKLILKRKRKSNMSAQKRVVTTETRSWSEHREQPSVLEISVTNWTYVAQLLPQGSEGFAQRAWKERKIQNLGKSTAKWCLLGMIDRTIALMN